MRGQNIQGNATQSKTILVSNLLVVILVKYEKIKSISLILKFKQRA